MIDAANFVTTTGSSLEVRGGSKTRRGLPLEDISTSSCGSGARARVGSRNHVGVVSCCDYGPITLHGEDPSKQTLPGFAPSAVSVTVTLDPPFKMSERHIRGKLPNRERQVAPGAVSHLHLVQADVIVNKLIPSSQPATADVDKVCIRREQFPRALHVVPVPGPLPTVRQHGRSALWGGGFVGIGHLYPQVAGFGDEHIGRSGGAVSSGGVNAS